MGKETFDVARKYSSLLMNLELELSKLGIEESKIGELYKDFDVLYDDIFKVGTQLDEEKFIDKEVLLIKKYEDLSSYIRLLAIYEYGDDLYLCETTPGEIYLIPKEYLSFDL